MESNEVNHSSYCIDQVSLNERNHSQFITENGTPAEVQEERRKYSRFGPGQPLQRNFRFTHTRKAVETGKLEIKSVAEEQLFHTKKKPSLFSSKEQKFGQNMANFIRQYFFAPWSNRNFERFEALFENESKTFPKNLARKF